MIICTDKMLYEYFWVSDMEYTDTERSFHIARSVKHVLKETK
jgi:hypothetical protein